MLTDSLIEFNMFVSTYSLRSLFDFDYQAFLFAESVTCIQTDASIEDDKPMKCFSEHIIIGSRKITENKDLLSEIENRLNLTLIERDYSQFYKTFGEMEFYKQPDIIVDERTSIILLYEHELDGDNCHSKLANMMSSMMLKCLNCYVIAVLFASKNT